jgi:hypothetical protein
MIQDTASQFERASFRRLTEPTPAPDHLRADPSFIFELEVAIEGLILRHGGDYREDREVSRQFLTNFFDCRMSTIVTWASAWNFCRARWIF